MADSEVAIVGSGLIGRSYAMLLASAGYQVSLYDIDVEQISRAKDDIRTQLLKLEEEGLLRGTLSREEQYQLITGLTDLKSCVEGLYNFRDRYGDSLFGNQLDLQADPIKEKNRRPSAGRYPEGNEGTGQTCVGNSKEETVVRPATGRFGQTEG